MDAKGWWEIRNKLEALGSRPDIQPIPFEFPPDGNQTHIEIEQDPDGGSERTRELVDSAGLTNREKSPSLRYVTMMGRYLLYKDTALPGETAPK